MCNSSSGVIHALIATLGAGGGHDGMGGIDLANLADFGTELLAKTE
jgi:hypothetical protein